ncbi:hypothetical protein, unlikely [Trypanosoma brucei gambiense DAL972]|uniref:Uncharacterized protein n=1 Tax=Trypanosoma brucei gambiense (strain MHOM/CI/86/DAL972) TaxID=679716 RepID=D0A702_TRYB9|nr:hypothetical protein, unlikely [Trypanosoma brucei gambiense DAL972]CBH17453.1 hypothetical protein, unlikely [Trypanosoma brucei gambiense DAL972]|eukprot:XP_011779717.1 hypothetical protein, unlikely [Trypanosoma brucei gambiense DAL972]
MRLNDACCFCHYCHVVRLFIYFFAGSRCIKRLGGRLFVWCAFLRKRIVRPCSCFCISFYSYEFVENVTASDFFPLRFKWKRSHLVEMEGREWIMGEELRYLKKK